ILLGTALSLGPGWLWPDGSTDDDPRCAPNCGPVDPIENNSSESGARRPAELGPDTNPDGPTGDDYRAALAVTVAAVDQQYGSITPRAMAQMYAGESDFITDAETFLTAMLKRWPEDPDTPLGRNAAGVQGLLQYASVFATLETG